MNLKQELFLFYMFIVTLGGLLLRGAQIFFATEPATGYAISGSISTVAVYIAVCVALVVGVAGFFFIKKNDIFIVYHDTKDASILGRASIVIFILGLSFFTVVRGVSFFRDGLTAQSSKAFSLIITTVILFIVTILLFIYLFMMLFSDQSRRDKGYELLILSPVIFSIVRLVDIFIRYTGRPYIFSRTLEIVALITVLLFFSSYAKARTARGSTKLMFILGLLAVFFTSVSAIPRLALMQNYDADVTTIQFISSAVFDISIIIYIIAAIFPVWIKSDDDDDDDDDEQDEYGDEDEDYEDSEDVDAEYEDFKDIE